MRRCLTSSSQGLAPKPLVCTSHPENGVLPLPMNGAAGLAYYFHCVKSRRGREVSLLTKSMTSLASRFTGSLRRKGTSRFWVYHPSAHLLGRDLPDTLPGNANIHAWQQSGKSVPEEKPPWTELTKAFPNCALTGRHTAGKGTRLYDAV